MQNAASVTGTNRALFDQHGRRIPYSGMRVHNPVSRQYFHLIQPRIEYPEIWARTVQHLQWPDPPCSTQRFAAICEAILEGLRSNAGLANLTRGVRVPFLCPPVVPGSRRNGDLQRFLQAVDRSFTDRFPEADFLDLCPGRPGDLVVAAPGSRYEEFEHARNAGAVAGIYFPNCLAEYDLASQRKQMETLPEAVPCNGKNAPIVLSGAVEAAAALAGTPDLLANEAHYPHHLCLSALQEPGDQIVYTFEAYGSNLRFRYRSTMLTPSVTQLSEQWAGGLTVFLRIV